MPEATPLRWHEDPALFRQAVTFTTAETGFTPRLIEKDYFCSMILQHLAAAAPGMIFKGGTCLAKVHVGFSRLSEDLDFLIPTPVDATRAERSRRAVGSKAAVAAIGEQLPGVRVVTPLTGANDSSQHVASIRYTSLLSAYEETVQIEVALREPLLARAIQGAAKTLLLDPISGSPLVPGISVPCLSREEAMAEKLRAALTRREAAIRDFYDVDHAVRRMGVRMRRQDLRAVGGAVQDLLDHLRARVGVDPDLHARRAQAGKTIAGSSARARYRSAVRPITCATCAFVRRASSCATS